MIRFLKALNCFLTAIFLLSLLSCNSSGPAPQYNDIEIDLSDKIVFPKHYLVPKAVSQVIIDGRANEPAWEFSAYTDAFADISSLEVPQYETRCKMLWDSQYLYIFALLEEEHIWGNIKERDQIIYYNNDFEVFIDPAGHGAPYAEIEINALGTVWDLLLNKPYRTGGKAIFDWTPDDLKCAVYAEGTLNDPSDLDSFWTVEMAVPLKSIAFLKHPVSIIPEEGEQWRVNFSRVQWQFELLNGQYQRKKENGKFLKEDNWVWSPQGVVNMHEPEKWGFLQFTHDYKINDVYFIQDKSLKTKQVLYALFREILFGTLKNELKNDQPGRIIKCKTTANDFMSAFFLRNSFGFTIEASCPQSNETFVINQDGHLKLKR